MNLYSVKELKKNNNGYIALFSVLIIGALLLLLTLGFSSRTLSVRESTLAQELAVRAQLLAHGCVEIAINKLKNDLNYSGNETIIVDGSDTCMIVGIGGSGNTDRTIYAQAIAGAYVQKVQVSVSSLRPRPTITRWESVADFE